MICWFTAQPDSMGADLKPSAVAGLTGLLTPSTPRISKDTVSVYTDAIFIRGSCTLLYRRVVFLYLADVFTSSIFVPLLLCV